MNVERSLARLATMQACVALAIAAGVSGLPTARRDGAWAAIAMVLVAMAIGLVPLRLLLRGGPEQVVAGWVAAMIVRMAATLVGLVLLLKRYRLDLAACVWTTCGVYVVLVIVEAIGLSRLVRREFERRQATGEVGDR